MKTQFQRDIDAIVNHAINEDAEHVRICPYCDREHNIQVGSNQVKSHGATCKKHLQHHLNYMTGGDPALMKKFSDYYATLPDEQFSPEYRPPTPV